MSLAAPVLMGVLGSAVKKQGITTATGFANLLAEQKDTLIAALPAGLGSITSLSAFTDGDQNKVPGKGKPGWLPWLLALAAAALLFALFGRGCQKEPLTQPAAIEDATKDVIEVAPAQFRKTLADGSVLNAPDGGIESQLVAFIDDANRPVDETTWFNFDRLTFKTREAVLDLDQSGEQLNNIVEILKAYPNVNMKIGAYTDNTGDPAANLKLSEARAQATFAELVSRGVDPARLAAEGYGDQHPVASNDTEEGRTQNRRVAVRVTGK